MEVAEKTDSLTEDEQVLLNEVLHEGRLIRSWLRWGPLYILIGFLLWLAVIAFIPLFNDLKTPIFSTFLVCWHLFLVSVWARDGQLRALVRKLHQESQQRNSVHTEQSIMHQEPGI